MRYITFLYSFVSIVSYLDRKYTSIVIFEYYILCGTNCMYKTYMRVYIVINMTRKTKVNKNIQYKKHSNIITVMLSCKSGVYTAIGKPVIECY